MKILLALFLCVAVVACAESENSNKVTAKLSAPGKGVPQKGDGLDGKGREGQGSESSDQTPMAGGIGFYNLSNVNVPEAVRTAAESVFEIKLVAGVSADHLKTVNLTGENADGTETLKKIEALPDFSGQEKMVLSALLTECVEKKADSCVLDTGIVSGSGFLLNAGNMLVTSAHVIEHFVKEAKKKSISEEKILGGEVSLRIFLFKNGQLVFGSPEDKAVISTRPVKSKAAKGNFYGEDTDMVTILLSKSIGAALKARAAKPVGGEKIFVLGYPTCTGCEVRNLKDEKLDYADRGDGLNSEGGVLKVSTGPIVEFADAAKMLSVSEEDASLFDPNQLIFFEADSQHGSSGGPVLSESGEVIAAIAGGKSSDRSGKLRRLSRGVRSLNWK
jgi:S1-C subfamily serine protease